MKKTILHTLLLLIVASAIVGCKNKETETTTYPEALVTGMTFAKNDSFPGLRLASFTIITASDTGLIYNKDSLLYGTCLDSVVPYITFNHTPSYAVFVTDSDSLVYSGADTLNMTYQPCRLYVMASDGIHDKWYNIYVNVHKVDPDLYNWTCLNERIYTGDGGESKAVRIGGKFYLFVNDGFSIRLYQSADAAQWTGPTTVTTLPTGCSVRNILAADDVLYYGDGDQLYTSTDATTWTKQDYSASSFRIINMLYCFNDSIWAIAQRRSDDKLILANMAKDGQLQLSGDTLPDNFPVSDYAAISFASASNRSRAMIVGGYDIKGNSLNTRWNIEYLKGRGYTMTNFSIEQPSFEALTGVNIIWYDHKFHMFGSANANTEIGQYKQLISYDEGLNWVVPDSTKNCLPEAYLPRQKASVIVDENHNIYIIGGQSRTETFSDVWRGHLNKTSFVDYED